MASNKIDVKQLLITGIISGIAISIANLTTKKLFGLSSSMPIHSIAYLPSAEQARFASQEVMRNAKDEKWLVEQFANVDPNNSTSYANLTSQDVANLAFVSLYGSHKESQLKAVQMLEKLKIELIS